jgi:Flp pilus assembly protein protease CpaA
MGDYLMLILPLLIILCFFLVFIFTNGIGGGDIKLFVLLSLTVGFYTPFIMILSFLLAGIYGYILKKKEIRLAPFITVSFLIILLTQIIA